MAITISLGYDGDLTEDQISLWAQFLGGPKYQFGDHDAWKVTDAAGDRTVQVAPGWAYGKGVADYNDAAIASGLQSSAVSSGSRWDLISRYSNWSTNTTTVRVIEGTPTRAIPAGRTARLLDSGATDDAPLALVRYAAGQTEPQEIIDLRTFDGIGRDLIAFVDPVVGDVAKVGTAGSYTEYVYDLDGMGNPGWIPLNVTTSGAVPLSGGIWRARTTPNEAPTWRRTPHGRVHLSGLAEYVGSGQSITASGLASQTLGGESLLPLTARPYRDTAQVVFGDGPSGGVAMRVTVTVTGRVHFAPLAASSPLTIAAGFALSLDGVSYAAGF